ncbi:MAG TPA: 50S ribosomal protein L3 [bacterium]|nr:50S ribosomal protein L3 [bacterium]
MNFILGTKIRMTQIFTEDARVIPVTEISVKPSTVLRVKTKETDGYESVVLAYGNKNKVSKSILGFFKNLGKFRYIREFRTDGENIELKQGDKIGLNSFTEGEKVKVSSVSKGKGFQGVVKRHGFNGGPRTHGDKDQMRMGGSVGATEPRRVFKGRKMPGRMGSDMVSIKNLEIVKIDPEKDLLYVMGAVSGGRNALVMIMGSGNMKIYEDIKKQELVKENIEEPTVVESIDNSVEVPITTEEKPQEQEIIENKEDVKTEEAIENKETKQE